MPAWEALAQLFPPLRTYWPHLAPTETSQGVSDPQAVFLLLDCLDAFYGGAAGGGKSDALLAAALQYVDVPGYAAALFRRTYTDLALPGALMARSHEWLQGKAHWNHDRKTWTFPSNATITFGYLDNPRDVYRYQSSEFQFIGFDELTQFEEQQFLYLFSRLRKRRGVEIPLRMRAASNPGNVGHGWVKRRYIVERKPDVMFVPARISDNPGLDEAEYAKSLAHLPEVLRRQLMEGDWGAFEGAAFALDETAHLVPAVESIADFSRFESMDHGISNPTAWLAWAADFDGNLIVFDSYYSPGIVSEHATAIKALREQSWERRDEDGWTIRNPVYGDPSIRNRTGGQSQLGEAATTVTEYADHGISLALANNDPRAGYAHLRELLKIDVKRPFPQWHPRYGEYGAPRIYFVAERCPELVEQLQTAPLQPTEKRLAGEIVDPEWESRHGHAIAALRYGAMSRALATKQPEPEVADPRAAQMVALMERRRSPKKQTFVEY